MYPHVEVLKKKLYPLTSTRSWSPSLIAAIFKPLLHSHKCTHGPENQFRDIMNNKTESYIVLFQVYLIVYIIKNCFKIGYELWRVDPLVWVSRQAIFTSLCFVATNFGDLTHNMGYLAMNYGDLTRTLYCFGDLTLTLV